PDVPWRDYALPGPPPELPVVALVGHQAATGARFIIDHWEPARDAPSPASILSDADLAALATSPAREAIKANVIDHFAVLLYAPGPDTARPAVGRAIEDYADATGEAIALVTVDRSDPRERVLLSFAGIAEDGPDWAGVVFGRGKLAAPPLEGADITEANLSMLFDAVAAPCTCIESPATLGVDMPLAWEASLDALTAPLLPPAYSEGVLEGLTLDTPRPAPPVMDSEPVPDAGPGLLGAAAGAAGAAAAVAGGAMLLVFVRFRRRNASR
ncbi:MAG: hypothetical protein JXR94_24520, partial [Candidatus Hydrogenedentes bacterium]|nr:hypothetical protein [Candidatus Hydrogenedentota bacterium]